MRSRLLSVVGAVGMLVLAQPALAGLISKTYEFKDGVTLEIGAQTDEGLRIDGVRFHLPSNPGGGFMRTSGLASAEVSISNVAQSSRKVGIAIALFDPQGRLVGVASGGTKLLPIKPDRQKTYRLVFEDVNGESFKATTFQISVEPKP